MICKSKNIEGIRGNPHLPLLRVSKSALVKLKFLKIKLAQLAQMLCLEGFVSVQMNLV